MKALRNLLTTTLLALAAYLNDPQTQREHLLGLIEARILPARGFNVHTGGWKHHSGENPVLPPHLADMTMEQLEDHYYQALVDRGLVSAERGSHVTTGASLVSHRVPPASDDVLVAVRAQLSSASSTWQPRLQRQ